MEIIGVVSTYKEELNKSGLVKDLNVDNIEQALLMVELDKELLNEDLKNLSLKELWKIDLITKLNNDVIIVGNMSYYLNYKDIEYIKKLLVKLASEYNKKVIVIDNNINVFINLVNLIRVVKNDKIIYETDNYYDDKLYEYVKMPKIIDFIKYVNKDKKILDNHLDIHELIKDIYRGIS